MSLMSMTGFGEAVATRNGVRASVSVRGVNNKQLDARATLPGSLSALEGPVVDRVRERCHRGRVDVRVTVVRAVDAEEPGPPSAELASLVGALRDLRTQFDLAGDVTVGDVLRAGGVSLIWSTKEPSVDDAREPVDEAVAAALDSFVAFRSREGAGLETVFRTGASDLAELVTGIEADAGEAITAHRERLADRVRELLSDERGSTLDAGRLEQEVVLLADRSDIAEEIQRARAHIGALRDALDGPGPHGKRLDFILQELVRETNTMASKSVSAQLTHRVVDAKTIIERLREQAQNVE